MGGKKAKEMWNRIETKTGAPGEIIRQGKKTFLYVMGRIHKKKKGVDICSELM